MLAEAAAVLASSLAAPLTKTVIESGRRLWKGRQEPVTIEIGTGTKLEYRNVDIDIRDLVNRVTGTEGQTADADKGAKGQSGTTKKPPRVSGTNVRTANNEIVVSPTFKLVFLTIVFLTLICGLAATTMAFAGDAKQANQQAVFESMNTAWKLGLGAIFGLLGGKAVT
jgi:hypothetical protein